MKPSGDIKSNMAAEINDGLFHEQKKTPKELAYIYSEREGTNPPPGFGRRTKEASDRGVN